MDEKGFFIWSVVSVDWVRDNEIYRPNGFKKIEACFTIKDLAQDFAREKSIEDFRSIAIEQNFNGFASPEFKTCKLHYYSEWEVDQLCEKWSINKKNFSMNQSTLDRMSDDKILELMKLLGLTFYRLMSAKVIC